MPDQRKLDYYNRRLGEMKIERESFIAHYRDLTDFVKPRRGRYFTTDRNKGDKRYQNIINSAATQAHKIATAGMLAGTMSPARPWFALETHDPDLMDRAGVKQWLYRVEQLFRLIFSQSNFYGMASQFIGELLIFGTAAMTHVDDFDDVARFYTHTAGSYMVAQNDKQIIDTLYREYEMTPVQMAQHFGINNLSTSVKRALDLNRLDQWFPVVHAIEPNDDFRPSSPFARNKPFKSVYYEPGNNGEDMDKLLSESGFDEFPGYVTRWELTGEDIYGTDCPAMTALGDIKGLQIEEKRKAQAIDKLVNPPFSGPPSVRNAPVSQLPGGLTVYDAGDGRQRLEPLYIINPHLQELRIDMDAIERRINSAFFVDLFLAISNIEGIQPRNQLDLIQRNEERLLQLGPVLERLHNDFLDNLIDRVFKQALRADILPEAPPELQGQALRVKYISSLAQAQRAVATQGIERVASFVGNLAAMGMNDAILKFNAAQAVDEYANAIGAPPSIIVPDEIVEAQKAQLQQQQQAAQAAELAETGARAAQSAAQAKLEDESLLSRMVDR